jgi:hypothetical protein
MFFALKFNCKGGNERDHRSAHFYVPISVKEIIHHFIRYSEKLCFQSAKEISKSYGCWMLQILEE